MCLAKNNPEGALCSAGSQIPVLESKFIAKSLRTSEFMILFILRGNNFQIFFINFLSNF